MSYMSKILETGCHNLRVGVATMRPDPDKEHQNAHVLASAITLTFCVIWTVLTSSLLQERAGLLLDRNSQMAHAQKQPTRTGVLICAGVDLGFLSGIREVPGSHSVATVSASLLQNPDSGSSPWT